jgi:GC-rich sequence DNA-binding factor
LLPLYHLQDDIKATGAKYTYVQGIRGYLADLCDCLADKGPLVEELEEALLGLREEAAAGGRAEVAVSGGWGRAEGT